MIYKAAEQVYKSVPKGQSLNMKKLRDEYGRIFDEKKATFSEYAKLNKDMHEYFIAKRNLEMLYQQDKQKNEKEGRCKWQVLFPKFWHLIFHTCLYSWAAAQTAALVA